MERLTKWNGSSNQHAYYPHCFEEPCNGGGCRIKDCPFETAVCERLAVFEDIAELCGGLARLRELAEADKDGRVVVLPCKGYSDVDIVRDGVSYRPDHWNIHLTAYAHEQNTPSGLKVGLFDIGEVERAMEGKT